MRKEDSIQTIKGIGEKTAESFARLGIFTIDDLLHTYPRNYLSYEEPVCIRDAAVGERHAIRAMITSYVTVKQVRSLKLTILTVSDGDMTMHMTWFNQPFLRNVFHKGDSYIFVGTAKVKNGMRVMEQAEYYKLPVYAGMQQEMQPVYPLTSGLSNKTFQKAIMATRELICQMDDYVPEEVRAEHSLMELSEAYENIHFPMNQAVLKNAIRRLAFDEFYQFLYDMASMKKTTQLQENLHKIVQGKAVADYISNLPFSLTKGQQQAIEDILADMGGDGVMNRLIQGDVGSGKTVVAAAALLACAKAGYQGALMAPTEVLARQHYEELAEQFAQYDIRTACLVGSTPLKEKRRIYEAIQQGEVDIVIGTHALLEDKVEFKDLALVVTDEQHRFGVNQRKKLSDKGCGVHTLVMSATPIPRTLAIILYADMDIWRYQPVQSWRTANPHIVNYWYEIDGAVKAAVKERKMTAVGRVTVYYQSGMLKIALPSGRVLSYVRPRMTVNRFGSESVSYEGVGTSRKWTRIESYGAKFCENIVQATARDVLAEAMLRLEKKGFDIVCHIHDEVVLEVPEGTSSVEEVNGIMAVCPDWCEGLPLKAAGFESPFYKKD